MISIHMQSGSSSSVVRVLDKSSRGRGFKSRLEPLFIFFLQIIQHIFVQKMSLEAREDREKQIECDELPFWS